MESHLDRTITDNAVAILQAMGFTSCFTVACILVAIALIARSVAKVNDRLNVQQHAERMEQMRLAATKEITVRPPARHD